jgi:hypothetical protein
LALVIARRSRLYADAGDAPRRVAWLGLLVFLVCGVAILASFVAARRHDEALMLPQYATPPWRAQTLTVMSTVGWLLTAVAALWTGVLGVALRRRNAIQELKRRTDRVRDYRTPPSPPRP